MMDPIVRVIARPSDLTAAWLSTALGASALEDFSVERIGNGLMSECYRVELHYADDCPNPTPKSVVLKVATTDPARRQAGLALGFYEREVGFYRDVAPHIVGDHLARCHHAAFNASDGTFHLLLDDVTPAVAGDDIQGATIDQARRCVGEMGRLHGPLIGKTGVAGAPWISRNLPLNQAVMTSFYDGFIDRYGDQVAQQHLDVCGRLVAAFDEYVAEYVQPASKIRIHGLFHGDYRLDNILFGGPGGEQRVTILDWQTVSWGPAMTDLAHFLGCALSTEERRAHYHALLSEYHSALGPVPPMSLDEVRHDVRRLSFAGVGLTIAGAMLGPRTERGDALFMTMLRRHCDHVLDTDALALLPTA